MSLSSNSYTVCEVPLVHIDDLSFSYLGKNPDGSPRETSILRGVKGEICDIPDHPQILAILAPSGLGKSTLLNIMAGIKPPANAKLTGSVYVYDEAGNKQREVEEGMVGVVAQDSWIMPHYTVQKNLLLAVSHRKDLSPAQHADLVKETLAKFDLTHIANNYPDDISGGQKQRVALAVQILCSGHYILLDEPFSGQDPLIKKSIAQQINEAAGLSELNTMIIVTHDTRRAVESADRLWMLGRERMASGEIIPGAFIKFDIDLAAEGLAWHPDIAHMPKFAEVVEYVERQYTEL